jgi:spermidine synthase
MQGQHFTGDLFDCACSPSLLQDSAALREMCIGLVTAAGLSVVGDRFHAFSDAGGVTGLVLLAESHLALHTWPELSAVTLDVYVCNFRDDNTHKAQALMDSLVALFAPASSRRNALERGVPQPRKDTRGSSVPLALEWLTPDVAHGFATRQPPETVQSLWQRLDWYDTNAMGRMLALDGAFMLSERDEFIYHECMAHVPALAHPEPRGALVMGGGDGCIARELLKHPSLETIMIAELDPVMIDECRTRLSDLNDHSFDNPRVQIVTGDALIYATSAKNAGEHFDLVIMDLSDPEFDEASALYSVDTYRLIRDLLHPDGVLSLHIGSPFFHGERFAGSLRALRTVFAEVHAYKAFMPLYGAEWGMACASMQTNPRALLEAEVTSRLQQRNIKNLRFYTAGVHASLFAWPAYAEKLGATAADSGA